MTRLSIRATAALARRHAHQHPSGLARDDLLALPEHDGVDPDRADSGIALALERGLLVTEEGAGGSTIRIADTNGRAA